MQKLVKAVLAVMDDCKGIEKSMTVGSGNNTYKGVSDKDVKLKVGASMHKHGLIILPTDVEAKTTINTWEEQTQYGNKMKQSAFVEVVTKYTLLHESGESIQLVGYGHGTDPQDKAAGKATTYALKYTLLYSFLVATGHIDDADNTHSDEIPVPAKAKQAPKAAADVEHLRELAAEYNHLCILLAPKIEPKTATAMQPKADWNIDTFTKGIAYCKAELTKLQISFDA